MKNVITQIPAMKRASAKRIQGMTLLELVVAVGIVLILAALSLAWFSHLRSTKSALTCASRSRVLTQAWTLYAVDHQGRIMNVFQPDGWAGRTNEYWIVQIRPYLSGIKSSDPIGKKIYFCTEPCPITGQKYPWIGLSEQLDPYQPAPAAPTILLSRINEPSRTVVFACSLQEAYHQRWAAPGTPYNNTYTYPHGGRTKSTFSFADGHVETVTSRDSTGRAIRPPQFIYKP